MTDWEAPAVGRRTSAGVTAMTESGPGPGPGPGPGAAVGSRTARSVTGLPMRPLSAGEILDGTFATIRRNPQATLGLSALLVSLQALITVAAQLIGGQLPNPVLDLRQVSAAQLNTGLTNLLGYLLAAVVGAILTGMIVVVVADDALGRPVTIRGVWRRVRETQDGGIRSTRLGALLVAAVIAGVLPTVGLVLLVAPGVLLWGGWALTTPALIIERLGPIQALRRSWRLAWPSFGRIWGIRAMSVLIGMTLQVLLALPFVAAGSLVAGLMNADPDATAPVPVLVLSVLGTVLASTVVAPFQSGVLALLYLDRRMRAEGLDIEWQRQLRRTRAGSR
ncbi:MAG: hypothetical protein HYR62_00415 [Actinobacteria bacterium]|nr:hypothetical protein [Actinomycetota bacterium]MBI3687826.1 hypothetical protein [Actinomycetota bacterium]